MASSNNLDALFADGELPFGHLEVWPESHWPGFDDYARQTYYSLICMIVSVIRFKNRSSYIDNRR